MTETGEARETSYLLQRLSAAIQRGNAAAVLGCAAHPDSIMTLIYLYNSTMYCRP